MQFQIFYLCFLIFLQTLNLQQRADKAHQRLLEPHPEGPVLIDLPGDLLRRRLIFDKFAGQLRVDPVIVDERADLKIKLEAPHVHVRSADCAKLIIREDRFAVDKAVLVAEDANACRQKLADE